MQFFDSKMKKNFIQFKIFNDQKKNVVLNSLKFVRIRFYDLFKILINLLKHISTTMSSSKFETLTLFQFE